MINKEEKELVELFKKWKNNNDTVVFELIYNKSNNLVYRIAFTILKNKDDSEDVVQSVFSKIYTLQKEKLPTEHILSWIYSVTKNEAISLYRKNKNLIDIDSIYNIADTDYEINNIIDKVEFNRLISKLNNKEKEVISLKLLSNLTFDEIAKLLNKPTGTIKWMYYKSIHTLKLLLSNLGMFIVTFIIGLKTITISKNGMKEYQNNFTENTKIEDNENINNQITTESMHSTTMQDSIEEKDINNQETQVKEEIQIPVKEPTRKYELLWKRNIG